jgi:energy-coupling factor transporter ATP-binding protein EcfA2
VIDVRNLSYRYIGGARDAVKDVSFSLEPGTMAAILGANGSGKSTLALLLAGLLDPGSGIIEVDGVSAGSPEGRVMIRKRVGMIFQDPTAQFTSPSVERELAFGLQNRGMDSAAMRAVVSEYLNSFDLEHLRASPPTDLSGGEQQRLAFASVLITRPRYLILDEPTTLLSPRSKETLLAMLESLRAQSLGVLLISQVPQDVLRADQVIVLHDGEMILSSSPGNLFSHADLLERCHIQVPLRFRTFS